MSKVNLNRGLGSLFGRFFTKLAGAVSRAIATVSPFLADMFVNLYNANAPDSWFNKIADYEPTPSEETILSNWTDNKFTPFHKQLLVQINSILNNSSLSYSQQLDIINSVLQKICIATSYIQNNDTAGLSAKAITWRADFVDQMFLPIQQIIEGILDGKIVELESYEITNQTVNYSPLAPANLTIASVYCERYAIPASVPVSEQNAPIQVTTQTLSESIKDTTTNTGTTTSATTGNNTGKVIAVCTLIAITLAALFPDSSSKKTNN